MPRLVTLVAFVAFALFASGSASSVRDARGCPRGALALTVTNPIGPATTAALRRVPAADRPQVTSAKLTIYDDVRGPQVRTQCGDRVAARTIIVYITRRAYLPAQSASQGVYFVSRFRSGYRVWQVAH
jgi:hypothetical protein